MSEVVEFMYKRFQTVIISATGSQGFVCSRMNNSNGDNEYKVSYWIESIKKEEWFYEFELRAI